jgi:hypothetical protein
MLKQGNGDFTPNLHHAGQKICILEIKGTVKADGEGNGFFDIINLHGGEVGVGERS